MNFVNQKNVVFASILLILLGWLSSAIAYEVNKSAVALLVAKNKACKTVGTGSGFVIQPEGTITTNYHVLVDAYSVKAYVLIVFTRIMFCVTHHCVRHIYIYI